MFRTSPFFVLLLLGAALSWGVQLYRSYHPVDTDGLPAPRREIHVERLGSEEYRERFEHLVYVDQGADFACRRLGLLRLGLVQAEKPSYQEPTMWGLAKEVSAYPAFYKLGTDTIFTAADHPEILRHEWVHALHDQYGDLETRSDNTRTFDESVALRAVIEGTALLFTKGGGTHTTPSDDFDRTALYVAYGFGRDFVARRSGSNPLSAFALKPQTVAEIIVGRPVTLSVLPEPALEPGERILCSDRLGVTGLLSMLQGRNEQEVSLSVVGAWRGDRMDVIRSPSGQTRVVWAVAFERERPANVWRSGPALSLPLTRPWVNMPVYVTQ